MKRLLVVAGAFLSALVVARPSRGSRGGDRIGRRSFRMVGAVLLIVCGPLIWPSASRAQVEAFLLVDGVDGGSARRARWSDVVSFSEITTAAVPPVIGEGGGGDVRPDAIITITKRVDKASVGLRRLLYRGTVIPSVKLELAVAGEGKGGPTTFLALTLEEVRFTKAESAGVTVDFPTERLELRFRRISYSWTEIRPDGTAGARFEFGWDFYTNN